MGVQIPSDPEVDHLLLEAVTPLLGFKSPQTHFLVEAVTRPIRLVVRTLLFRRSNEGPNPSWGGP